MRKKMKIESGDNFIVLDVSVEEDDSLPSYGDAHIAISVHLHGFRGTNDLRVATEEFQEFFAALVKLEKERKGEAVLNSISPGELNLKMYSTDSVGHLAVTGTTGHLVGDMPHSVTFGFEFEPLQLVSAAASPWVKQNAA